MDEVGRRFTPARCATPTRPRLRMALKPVFCRNPLRPDGVGLRRRRPRHARAARHRHHPNPVRSFRRADEPRHRSRVMHRLKSWRALLVREFIEHRIAFLYFPLGILGLFALSTASGLAYQPLPPCAPIPGGRCRSKLFELGYIASFALWFAYRRSRCSSISATPSAPTGATMRCCSGSRCRSAISRSWLDKFLAGVTLFPP